MYQCDGDAVVTRSRAARAGTERIGVVARSDMAEFLRERKNADFNSSDSASVAMCACVVQFAGVKWPRRAVGADALNQFFHTVFLDENAKIHSENQTFS